MQLFGLVNNVLATDRVTAERDLTIARYAVIPLSPNSGLIGWVPNTDTLHALIREYRDARKIPLNLEHRLMLGMAPDYDHLTVIQKVEVFEHALDSTSGEDLHKVLWLKSRNSEMWLDKRTNYTRSTAVMSMVGYILGLGDRHPSNLMLDRYSGEGAGCAAGGSRLCALFGDSLADQRAVPEGHLLRPCRQAAAHRLWRLLRGEHAPGKVPGEGALPAHPDDGQGAAGL